MTTEHEQPSTADARSAQIHRREPEDADERRIFEDGARIMSGGNLLLQTADTLGMWHRRAITEGMTRAGPFGSYGKMLAIMANECRTAALELDTARLALAERDAEIARLGLEKQAGDEIIIGLRQQVDELKAEISRLKAAPGYLSGKLNPFPERPGALAIAEKLIRAYLLDIGAGIDDFTQHEVEFAEKIAAAIGAAAHAPASSGASALEIAERFRVFFHRPYPMSEEGVERAVQALAQEIENAIAERDAEIANNMTAGFRQTPSAEAMEIAYEVCEPLLQQRPTIFGPEGLEEPGLVIWRRDFDKLKERVALAIEAAIRHNEARPGPSALEATRDLFQSLEGWRPTDDWTGVPPRLKLAFDRTLHAIEAAEARGRERL